MGRRASGRFRDGPVSREKREPVLVAFEVYDTVCGFARSITTCQKCFYISYRLLLLPSRYQGYVCPGILIVIASHANLNTVVDAWKRRLLASPPGGAISQLGISNGCMVKPVAQTHQMALQDAICIILARYVLRYLGA